MYQYTAEQDEKENFVIYPLTELLLDAVPSIRKIRYKATETSETVAVHLSVEKICCINVTGDSLLALAVDVLNKVAKEEGIK